MSRDYKKMPPKSASGKKGNPLLTGLMIGLFVGLVSAVGVALYVNHMPSPFTERTPQQTEPAPDKAAKQEPPATSAEKAPEKPNAAPAKPRFDFYNILPGSEEPVTEQNIKQAHPQLGGAEVFYLQAGAFQSENDADNLKAKLALLGIEAVIQTANLPDKGLLHRVRIGPYPSIDEAGKVRATLAQNKIDSSLIKVKDTPAN